jgi:hypothetical protein
MNDTVRLVMIYGNVKASQPSIVRAALPAEEFPTGSRYTGMKAWTALSFDGQRLVILALEGLRDKAIERWKTMQADIQADPHRFGLLLKARHVTH